MKRFASLLLVLMFLLLAVMPVAADTSEGNTTINPVDDGLVRKDMTTSTVDAYDDQLDINREGCTDNLGGQADDYCYRGFMKWTFNTGDWSYRSVKSATLRQYVFQGSGSSATMRVQEIGNYGNIGTEDWDIAVRQDNIGNWTLTIPGSGDQLNTISVKDNMVRAKSEGALYLRTKDTSEAANRSNWADYRTIESASNKQSIQIQYVYGFGPLSASQIGRNSLIMSWSNSGALDSNDSQEVRYAAKGPGSCPVYTEGNYTLFSTVSYNTTWTTVTGLSAGTAYCFYIRDVQVPSWGGTGIKGSLSTLGEATTLP